MKQILLVTILFLLSLHLHGQSGNTFNLTLNHVALSVTDVNRSADFYGKTMKLEEITNRTKVDGIRWFSLGEGKELHLISTLKGHVAVNKAVHLGLTTPDFVAFVTMLQNMKVAYSDWPGTPNKISVRADGVKQVFFQDPDGYWVEVNSVAQK